MIFPLSPFLTWIRRKVVETHSCVSANRQAFAFGDFIQRSCLLRRKNASLHFGNDSLRAQAEVRRTHVKGNRILLPKRSLTLQLRWQRLEGERTRGRPTPQDPNGEDHILNFVHTIKSVLLKTQISSTDIWFQYYWYLISILLIFDFNTTDI